MKIPTSPKIMKRISANLVTFILGKLMEKILIFCLKFFMFAFFKVSWITDVSQFTATEKKMEGTSKLLMSHHNFLSATCYCSSQDT